MTAVPLTLRTFAKLIKAAGAALIITGCTLTQSPQGTGSVSTTEAFGPLTLTLEGYQDLTRRVSDDSAFNAGILLARSQIVARDLQSARASIETLRQRAITPLQHDEVSIIEALLLLEEKDYLGAYSNLNSVNEMTLPAQAASYYYQLTSRTCDILYRDSHNESYLERAFASQKALLNVIGQREHDIVLQRTVDILRNYPTSRLVTLESSSRDPLDRGYYAFAVVDSASNQDIKRRLAQSFLEKYQDHPLAYLAQKLSSGAPDENAPTLQSPGHNLSLGAGDHLAVLLPLSGRFENTVGDPARLGILAALQDIKPDLKVVFYDTSKVDMAEITAALKNNHTDFVIGPLLKPNVDAYLNAETKIPTVLLNSTELTLPENTWYFDLSPEYEGRLAASKMVHDGISSIAVVSSGNQRSQRAASAFVQSITQARGRRPDVCTFNNLEDLNSKVTACRLDMTGGVYISATALEASEIKAILPGSMRVYITNQSNTGVNSSSLEMSMYGALLGDMPWLITESPLKQEMMENLPKADAQVQRIFATAYDAVGFALNADQLTRPSSPDVLHGLSGDVRLGNNGLIESAPMWVTLGITQRE